MKNSFFEELGKYITGNLNQHQRERWRQKLRYPAALAFVGTLLIGWIAVWGTLAAVSGLVSAFDSANPKEQLGYQIWAERSEYADRIS